MTAKARTRTITLTPFRNNIAPMTITVALPSYIHDIEQFQRTFSAHVIAVLNARPAEVFDRLYTDLGELGFFTLAALTADSMLAWPGEVDPPGRNWAQRPFIPDKLWLHVLREFGSGEIKRVTDAFLSLFSGA